MSDIQAVPSGEVGQLLDDIHTLIDGARQQVAVTVNAELTALYWQMGRRIRKDLMLEEARVAYGEEIVATLSRQLTQSYGKGYTKSALMHEAVAIANTRLEPQSNAGELRA
jgi:hypothetical protein